MLFLGSAVVAGRAVAAVTATGAETELGHIGTMITSATKEATPLEAMLETFGKRVLIGCLALSLLLLVWGLLRPYAMPGSVAEPWHLLLLEAVSLAVAAILEGLPAITTITLALGTQRLAKRGAIVRRLPAVETLGAATFICTDKTGTLTQANAEGLILGMNLRQEELNALETRIRVTRAAPETVQFEVRRMEAEARLRIERLRETLDRNRREARALIEFIFDGKLTATPTQTPDGPRFAVEGIASVGRMLAFEGDAEGSTKPPPQNLRPQGDSATAKLAEGVRARTREANRILAAATLRPITACRVRSSDAEVEDACIPRSSRAARSSRSCAATRSRGARALGARRRRKGERGSRGQRELTDRRLMRVSSVRSDVFGAPLLSSRARRELARSDWSTAPESC